MSTPGTDPTRNLFPQPEPKPSWHKNTRCLWIAAIVVFSIVYGGTGLIYLLSEPSYSGQFGDTFGAANALVSGVALIFVGYTLIQQRDMLKQGQRQLEIQQEELKQNTAALQAQKDEFVKQVQSMQAQELDNQFFQLLRSLNNIIEISSYEVHSKVSTGLDCFSAVYNHIQGMFRSSPTTEKTPKHGDSDAWKSLTCSYFSEVLKQYPSILPPFLNTTFSILRFLDRECNDPIKRKFYFEIVASQMSPPQKQFLMYDALLKGDDSKEFQILDENGILCPLKSEPNMLLMEHDLQFFPSLVD